MNMCMFNPTFLEPWEGLLTRAQESPSPLFKNVASIVPAPAVTSAERWEFSLAITVAVSIPSPTDQGQVIAGEGFPQIEGVAWGESLSHPPGIVTAGYPLKIAWDSYLSNLGLADSRISNTVAEATRSLWQCINLDGTTPIPHAAPTEDGDMVLTWDCGDHHVDVDVLADGTFEWFYSNRRTGFFEGEEGLTVGGGLPDRLRSYLCNLV